jgi:hypothetical protein
MQGKANWKHMCMGRVLEVYKGYIEELKQLELDS